MHGIVSLLEPNYNQLVEQLWAELERRFHVHGAFVTKIPHFTLCHDDITSANLGPIVTWLNQQNLNWEISINNFAILRDPGDRPHDLVQRFDFGN